MKPLLITEERSGTHYLLSVLRYFKFDPACWPGSQQLGRSDIAMKCPVWDHFRVHYRFDEVLEKFKDVRVVVLIRQDIDRQVASWLIHQEQVGYRSRHFNMMDSLKVPDLALELICAARKRRAQYLSDRTKMLSALEGVPSMTIVYEHDLLGQDEAGLTELVQRLCQFWEVKWTGIHVDEPFWEGVHWRCSDLATEVFYQELKQYL